MAHPGPPTYVPPTAFGMEPPPWPRQEPSGVWGIVAAVFVGLWSVSLAVLSQFVTWVVEQFGLQTSSEVSSVVWLIIGLALFLLTGGPALLLALVARHPGVRATGRAFTLAAGVMGIGSALRIIPATRNEFYLLTLALLAGGAAVLLRRPTAPTDLAPAAPTTRSNADESGAIRARSTGRGALGWAVFAGLLVLIPLLWAGALGGWLETITAALAAFAVVALTAVILGPSRLDPDFWGPFRTGGKAKLVLVGGLVAGTTLAMIAAGLGASGIQLLELLVLPPLGFAAAALAPASPRGAAIRVMIGLAAFGPLAFVDPDEVNISLYDHDVPYWAMLAELIACGLGLLLGLGYGIGLLRTVKTPRKVVPRLGGRPVAAAMAGVALLGAGLVYAAGQPGFYGDRLFVVLKDQASLAGLPTTTGLGPGRNERVTAVYRRLVDHAQQAQAGLRTDLDRLHLSYQPYYLVNAILVTGGPAVRAWLESRDDVDRVLMDQRLRPLPKQLPISHGTQSQPPAAPTWNVQQVRAPELWQRNVTGEGIVVGSSDSGVDGSHPALAAHYRGGDDSWLDPWSGSTAPVDHNGHGTHTLATAVGQERVGVAPGAQWIACVNLQRNMASPSLYLDCMQFMLAPYRQGGDPFSAGRPARAPHVLNNSWGCPPLEGCDNTVLRPATQAITAAGIAFVAAAGNSGPACGSIVTPPATDPNAITVAAVDRQRVVADFSSRGPADGKPDLAAPGVAVLSAMPGGTYAELDGTSMAAPHVAGVITLLWSARPELVGDLARTRELLQRSALRPGTAAHNTGCGTEADRTGAGIVNAEGAMSMSAAAGSG